MNTSTRTPSPRALATTSLRLATRQKGEARREALQKHAAQVWPAKTCSTLTSRTTRVV